MDNALLTAQEVADHFRVSRRTLQRWIKNGHLNAIVTPGGHRRFDPEEVKRFLVSQRESVA